MAILRICIKEMPRWYASMPPATGETVPGVISKGGEEGRDRHATQGERVPLRALHAGEASRGDAGEDGVGVEGNSDAAREFDVGVDAEGVLGDARVAGRGRDRGGRARAPIRAWRRREEWTVRGVDGARRGRSAASGAVPTQA